MDKVWIVLLQVLTGYMPQAFGFLLFVYGFCDQKWNHRYWLGGLLLSALSIIARLLPIVTGVSTLLVIISLILISTYFCRLPMMKCIISSLLTTIVMLVVELPAVTLYPLLIGKEAFLAVQQDELQWALYGIPTTLLFWLVVAIFYVVRMRRAVRRAKVDTEGGAQPGGSAGG